MTFHARNTQHPDKNYDYTVARLHMIDGQLRPNGIKDYRLLDAIEAVPRELFMAPPDRGLSCVDTEIAVSSERYLLRPLVQARLLQAAGILETDRVLDIACGSGYSSALAARLGKSVVALDCDPNLTRLAAANLADSHVSNVQSVTGALQDGWVLHAPYDVIIINGAVEKLPDNITNQLAENGRLVTIIRQDAVDGFSFTSQLTLFKRMSGALHVQPIIEATAYCLAAFRDPKGFVF